MTRPSARRRGRSGGPRQDRLVVVLVPDRLAPLVREVVSRERSGESFIDIVRALVAPDQPAALPSPAPQSAGGPVVVDFSFGLGAAGSAPVGAESETTLRGVAARVPLVFAGDDRPEILLPEDLPTHALAGAGAQAVGSAEPVADLVVIEAGHFERAGPQACAPVPGIEPGKNTVDLADGPADRAPPGPGAGDLQSDLLSTQDMAAAFDAEMAGLRGEVSDLTIRLAKSERGRAAVEADVKNFRSAGREGLARGLKYGCVVAISTLVAGFVAGFFWVRADLVSAKSDLARARLEAERAQDLTLDLLARVPR